MHQKLNPFSEDNYLKMCLPKKDESQTDEKILNQIPMSVSEYKDFEKQLRDRSMDSTGDFI